MRRINTVIPMAGLGSRFAAAGYTFPKPLITVKGKPMIQLVIENMQLPSYAYDQQFIFITQKEHSEKYDLKDMLTFLCPTCIIYEIDHVTEGAACTVLKVKDYINNDIPLFMANSDQYVEWYACDTIDDMMTMESDGSMVVFESVHPKNSFVKLDQNGYAIEVAEKKVISNLATNGLYFWKRGADFIKYAERMIAADRRVNGEFYVAPVYQEAINDGLRFRTVRVQNHWPIGIPEDLKYFEDHYGI